MSHTREKHPPAYLSPSRLTCYAYCPAEFHKRYILKIDEPPNVERMFGTAVHRGLEAHFRDQDDELAFLRDWRASEKILIDAGQVFSSSALTTRGLELLDMVRGLDLSGEPEHRITVLTDEISLPIIGYVDLWAEGHLIDFKTTGFGWTQAKADQQIFQPAIYSQAHADEYGSIPKFSFVVLSRTGGPVQTFDGSRSGEQILDAFDRATEIHQAIEAGQFDCVCGKHQEKAA